MFHFLKKSSPVPKSMGERRRVRGAVTIGFEQLEVREMLSTGVALTIIPTETRPFFTMPRPQVGYFNPEAERALTVVLTPSREPEESSRPIGLWPLSGRFRFRIG